MTNVHYRRIHDPDDAINLILDAMSDDKRHPVTLGYKETRKELRPPKRGNGPPAWYPVPGHYVFTVRTMEFFDLEETEAGHICFIGLDRCPRDDVDWLAFGPPKIRKVRADRIEDLTVHVKSVYRLVNAYFIQKVRDHAKAQRWPTIPALTDDALWSVIELAHDPTDAIGRAARYAGVELTPSQ